jgi:hypothetical protein
MMVDLNTWVSISYVYGMTDRKAKVDDASAAVIMSDNSLFVQMEKYCSEEQKEILSALKVKLGAFCLSARSRK